MAKMGYCDFSEITKFQKQLEQIEKDGRKEMCERCAKRLAASLLSLVIPRTPVGNNVTYINEKGIEETEKNGGTLKRGWTANSQEEAETGGNKDIDTFLESVKVEKSGDNYTIVIENPVMYSSYVEYGHRQTPGRYVPAIGKRLKASWVEGKYMLTKSEQDLQSMQVGILERELEEFFKEYFGE